ncbi:MAG: hypothetical protein ACI8RD_011798, partial [Bacillariaceae sp.]
MMNENANGLRNRRSRPTATESVNVVGDNKDDDGDVPLTTTSSIN